MAYQRTGFANWIDYDEQNDLIRYGSYQFNPIALGLQRTKQAFDPKTFKSQDDVYRALGANDRAITQNRLYGGLGGQVFSGADYWKNDIADQMWLEAQKANGTYKPPSIGLGLFGFGQGARTSSGFGTNAGSGMMGYTVTPPKPGSQDTRTVYKGDDGLLYLEYRQGIPQDQAFAQSISDATWAAYRSGQTMRGGKPVGGYGKSPYEKSGLNQGSGKTPRTSLLG